jgi:hypothetical protein
MDGEVPRHSLNTLLKLHRTWERYRHLNTARLFYLAARAIQQRAPYTLMLNQHQHLSHSSYIPALVRYTALKTRQTHTTRSRR